MAGHCGRSLQCRNCSAPRPAMKPQPRAAYASQQSTGSRIVRLPSTLRAGARPRPSAPRPPHPGPAVIAPVMVVAEKLLSLANEKATGKSKDLGPVKPLEETCPRLIAAITEMQTTTPLLGRAAFQRRCRTPRRRWWILAAVPNNPPHWLTEHAYIEIAAICIEDRLSLPPSARRPRSEPICPHSFWSRAHRRPLARRYGRWPANGVGEQQIQRAPCCSRVPRRQASLPDPRGMEARRARASPVE